MACNRNNIQTCNDDLRKSAISFFLSFIIIICACFDTKVGVLVCHKAQNYARTPESYLECVILAETIKH